MTKSGASLLDEPSAGQRFAIALTTLMAGVIGAYYMYFYWDYPWLLTIPMHMNPDQKRAVSWAPWWVPVSVMAVLSMAFWRLFVARARGISIKAAVTTLFILFALRHGIEFICIEYSTAVRLIPQPPLWHMIAVFPLQILGGLFSAAFMFLLGFPGDWVVMLVLALAAGLPTAALGRVLWLRLA